MGSTRTISIYLLKAGVGSARAVLREGYEDLPAHAVAAGETTGTLFVEEGRDGPPDWARFLAGATDPELVVSTRSARALMVLETAGRRFAITFGHARHLIDPDCYERDFGLLVALNGVDPEQLRGAEARTFDDYALHTLRQLSRLSSVESLELNTDRELVISLAGQLDDSSLGKKIEGRDAVRLTAELEPHQLGEKCGELLRISEQTDYRERFPFFDKIKRVRDPEEIAALNLKAFSKLGKREFDGFDLFPPQILAEEIVAFRVAPLLRGATMVAEPDSKLLRYPLSSPCSAAEAETRLRRFSLRAVDAGDSVVDEWSFFECLHWEVRDGDFVYVLDAGQWYRIEPSLVGDVDEVMRKLPSSGIEWPPAVVKQREENYNDLAASKLGFALLDQRFVKLPGQTKVEVCDIFTDHRQFIHVKRRKGGSKPLSHLFGQAMVSAESFILEEEFRRQFRERLEEAKPGFGRFSPKQVQASDYSVVLAMITSPTSTGNVAEKLPFFSKVMLRLAVRNLESMRYEVFVDGIPTRFPTSPKRQKQPALGRAKTPASSKKEPAPAIASSTEA